MKKYITIFTIFLLLGILNSCSEKIVYISTPSDSCSCNCPAPIEGIDGVHIPRLAHVGQVRSPDGLTLAFVPNHQSTNIGFIDLRTHTTRYVSLKDILPGLNPGGSGCGYLVWSPYSSDRLYLHCYSFPDSAGIPVYRQNGYIYTISTNSAIRVTPSWFGKYGSSEGFFLQTWLKGSSLEKDSLMLSGRGIYVPQEDRLYPIPKGYLDYILQSPVNTNVYRYKVQPDSTGPIIPEYYLNSIPFSYGNHFGPLVTIHWSPSGGKLLFSTDYDSPSTNPADPEGGYEKVWILDVVKSIETGYTAWIYGLDLQNLFCKYSFQGIDAEFITDTTLAVSMHKDGEDFSPLWEITTKGKLVRQLTFQ